ncbi:hypothetical protein DL96DRAFT_1558264 [Flagelloscypha sp. PMI_526]|nr:hypothetical protein DL96DRAFT_1558264 [Flagelloscypha sp. PMI_526]
MASHILSLRFLRRFSNLRSSIRHLSLGECFFYEVVSTISLKELRFTVKNTCEPPVHVQNNLDALGTHPAIELLMEFVVSAKADKEKKRMLLHYIPASFPAWDQAGRLKCWVKY